MKIIIKNSSLSALLLSTCSVPAAWSQSTPAAPQDALQEIVVTAEKREESAQKTPISIVVYTAEEVAKKGIVDLRSLAANDTSLQFDSDGGEGFLTMRGVSSHDDTEIGSPSVPVVVDNFASNRSWSLNNTMFDLERIEVLRGPQGTLFGRSSTGGLINIVVNKPTNEFAVEGGLEYGTYSTVNTLGVLNLPLSDAVQLRVAFNTLSHEGYHGVVQTNDTAVTNLHADDMNSKSGRVQLAFEPFDHFRGRLSYEFMDVNGLGNAQQVIPFNYQPLPGGAPCNYIISTAGTSPACSNDDIVHTKPALGNPASFPIYGKPSLNLDSKWFKTEFNYDNLPGGTTLSYVGGYSLQKFDRVNAGSTLLSFLGTAANGFFPTRQYRQGEEPHTQNHELRLTSPSDGPFKWQAGLYYFREENRVDSYGLLDPNGTDPATLAAANAAFAALFGAPPLPDNKLFEFFFPSVLQTSKAAYAQGTYNVTDNGAVSAGVRYNKDAVIRTGVFNIGYIGVNGLSEYGEASSTKSTYHLGYDWTPSTTHLLYAKLDTGYKPGGFDTCGSYSPENVTTGEVGSKNRSLDSHVQFNVAGFYSAYKDQQVSQFINSCISGTHTTNAGSSKIYGLESDMAVLVNNVGKFDVGLTFLHARFGTFLTPPVIGNPALVDCRKQVTTSQGINCDLSGNYLTGAPDLSIAAGFEHLWKLYDGQITARVEGKFTTKQYYDAFNFQDTEQPSYAVGNAYLDYVRGNWTVGLYVRNFTNTVYFSNAVEGSGNGSAEYDFEYGAPRTSGLRFRFALHKL